MKLILKEKGWTHEELARLLNVSRATITHYLNGRYRPSLETLASISTVL